MTTQSKRVTVYFDSNIYRALKLKALEMGESVSTVVNQAVQNTLSEDAEDLLAFEERAHEKDLDYEKVIKDMKKNGLL